MAKAYSVDLRKKVIDLINEGQSKVFISKVFKIDTKTIYNWLKIYKVKQTLEPNTKYNKRPSTIDLERLEKYIINNPSKTLKQIGKEFNCSYVAIFKRLKQLGYSFKKNDSYILKETKKREGYLWKK